MNLATPQRTILLAVQRHPASMSPVLLEYLLRGETIGRMAEKNLLSSPHHGALTKLPPGAIAREIGEAVAAGWLIRGSGFYPALQLSPAGEGQLALVDGGHCTETAPDGAYRAYYRWRQTRARGMRKPPYRIFTNLTVNQLALRRPVTLEELLEVPGLGKRRALRYQAELLEVGRRLAETDAPAWR